MIRVFTTLLFISFSVYALAQRAVCPQDTLKFIYSVKATNFDTTSFDPTLTSALYQYYAAPQDITVDGARFYGMKTDTLDSIGNYRDSMVVYVEMRSATNDSLPGGTIYRADTLLIGFVDTSDTSINFNSFDFHSYVGEFDQPYTTDQPYTIVIRTETFEDEFSLLHTEYDSINGGGDGDEEWLSGAFQGNGWVKSDVFAPNPNNIPFDADFFFEPIVRYNLDPSFINDPECLFDELGDTVDFFNEGALIVDHKMYNRYAAFGFPDGQIWNFGDGSPILEEVNPSHFYPTNGPFAATFTAKILSWTQQVCQDQVTQIIKEKPEQDFSYTTSNLDVQFTNETFGQFSNINWDFGDGNTSPNEDPFHKYSEPGTYWVCQTMITSCGEITQCKNVAVATNTALNCGKDSVRYTSARGTDSRKITLRNPASGQRLLGVGQRFEAPQSMIVHGFTFYANHNGLFRDSYPVKCRIWLKNNFNLPDTNIGPLAESTVRVNKYEVDSFYSDTTRYTAIFNEPANLVKDEDYLLTIEYDSTTHVYIGTTDWSAGDGDQDLLAIGKINDTTWVTAASVAVFNVNGQAFDADVVIEPLIEYNLDANFEWPFECMNFGSNGSVEVTFTDLSSQIVRSSIYNTIAFNSSNSEAFEWDFGDSTETTNQIDAIHVFEAPGPFDVRLTITMDGWTNDCQNSQILNVPVPPTAGFSFEQITSQVNFIDSSHNADEYLWTFSDTTISTLSDPIHFFTRIGKYEVCQYVSNECGSDTLCDSITISVIGIPENLVEEMQIYPNPASDYLNVKANLELMNSLDLELVDMSGRVVRRFESTDKAVNTRMYVGDLARGTYMLNIIAGEYRGTRKLILSR